MNATKQTALVTGASSGIGRECARILAAKGYALILVARRADKLRQLASELETAQGVSVTVIGHDLSQPHAADGLWETITQGSHRIDILVNNAGIGLAGEFTGIDALATEAMIELNVTSLTMLCRRALPDMLKRRQGRILNVASLTGYQPGGPGMAVYYASKSYVLSFTRGLARELRGSGVTATALCPGTTRTEFEEVSGAGNLRMFRWLPMSEARAVAEAGIQGMLAGRVSVVPGVFNKLLALGGELPPRQIAIAINRMLLRS